MRRIALSGAKGIGLYVLVDELDYCYLFKHKWFLHSGGYAVRNDGQGKNRKVVFMHREVSKARAGQLIDHVNGNRLDNRRLNLRTCTSTENTRHRTRLAANNNSGFNGVYWSSSNKRWTAQITIGRKTYYLGVFKNKADAIAVRRRASSSNFGKFSPTV